MVTNEYLKKPIHILATVYRELEDCKHLPKPVWRKDISQWRHEDCNETLFIFLKGVRYVSLLNAAYALLEHGFTQEIGILCRCMDETLEDAMLFLNLNPQDNVLSDRQTRVLADFYQEEFVDPFKKWPENKKRDNRVSRKQVRASLANMPGNPVNRSDFQKAHDTVYDTFSGYVHGAYPHIMELYGGYPPQHYHANGMKNTPRIEGWGERVLRYIYNGILLTQHTAHQLKEESFYDYLLKVRLLMEKDYPVLATDPNTVIANLKK